MMVTVLPRSWKDEFAVAARAKREELLHKDKLAWFEEQERLRRKKQEEADDRYDAETWALIEAVLASPEALMEVRVRIDEYDAKTVEALMENREALDAIRNHINELLEEAHILPDGRRVFKTKDGQRVFDEHGAELSPDVIDPDTIADSRPYWETYDAARQIEASLEEQQHELLEYQVKLDEARERLDSGEITQDELERMESDLAAHMPDAVREKLGLDQAKPDAAPVQEASATAKPEAVLPSDMDALMRQTGFGAAGPTGP